MISVISRVHPAISGCSLAFWLLLGGLDIVSLWRTWRPSEEARWAFWGLCTAILVTFLSGYVADGFLYPPDDGAVSGRIADHHSWGRWAVFILPIVAGARLVAKRRGDFISAIGYAISLSCLGAILLYVGYLGGSLVFDDGVGVMTRRG